ncbi:phage portal protein [Paenibacillus selenitireducens]|uniref:Phage portal protein n=1 Tax=Paenibacillus selenitireducens TaxID=1324314 RepID=A0A1T2XCF0_9BACL|nr:phage portal protein [Paenibacillus selenitireducens]OPA77505.1 phage portal protein [Paenibacillus selenitireducens]
MAKRWWKFWSKRSIEWNGGRFDGGGRTRSGELITTETAMLNSNVYTVASILGGDIGKFPLQVFKRVGDNIRRDTNHPVSKLLGKRSNPHMTAYTFKETMKLHCVVWGNAYAEIEFGEDGYPKALWPLDPGRTDVMTDLEGNVWYVTTLPNGSRRKLTVDQVLHFKSIGRSGLKGITPIEVIREELGIQKAQKKFLGSFYGNGTTVGGVLNVESDKPLTGAAKDRIRDEWAKINSGLDNMARVAILDNTTKYQALGMPLKDAEFIDSSKFGIAEVAKIYKVPGYKLGISDVKYSNMENQSLEYVKNTLQPIVTNWEMEIDTKLFTETEQKKYYVKFNMTSELRGDSATRAAFYKAMLEIGVLTINEVRLMEELDQIGPDGDKHFINLNLVNLANMDQYQNARAGTKGGEDDKEGNTVPNDPAA